jgi:hypothetical protein
MKWFRYIVEEDDEKIVWKDWNWDVHREGDRPAIIWSDGTEIYYKRGKKHRENGPAAIFLDGHEEWYFEGKFHRIGGPALTTSDGRTYFYINGEEYPEDKYYKVIEEKHGYTK